MEWTFAIPEQESDGVQSGAEQDVKHLHLPAWEKLLISRDFPAALEAAHRATAEVRPNFHIMVTVWKCKEHRKSAANEPSQALHSDLNRRGGGWDRRMCRLSAGRVHFV